MRIQRGVKEWSAVIDALGKGQQIILIRKREPLQKDLLLFPTFNYYQKHLKDLDAFDQQFQANYRASTRQNAAACMKYAHEELLADVDFYAHVEDVLRATSQVSLLPLKSH